MAEIMILVPTVNTTSPIYIQPWLQQLLWKATCATAAKTHPFGYFTDEGLALHGNSRTAEPVGPAVFVWLGSGTYLRRR